jgi:hypothetical protein
LELAEPDSPNCNTSRLQTLLVVPILRAKGEKAMGDRKQLELEIAQMQTIARYALSCMSGG